MDLRTEALIYRSSRIVLAPILWIYCELRARVRCLRWRTRDSWPKGGTSS
jgi:hypothetical protein